MRTFKIVTDTSWPKGLCNVVDCGREASIAHMLQMESPEGSFNGNVAGCALHRGIVADFVKSKLRADWFDENQLLNNPLLIFCSIGNCEEIGETDKTGWLGLNLLADVGGNHVFLTLCSCPRHARALMVAVTRELGEGITTRRAFQFRSSKGPIGFLFAMESIGFSAVTGMNPVTGDDILWPFGSLDDAVKKLDESIADFKKTRPDVEVVRMSEFEGRSNASIMLCPKCGGLLSPFGEELRVGESSTVSGLRCHNCGATLPPFRLSR